MNNDSISPASAAAILALLVGREVEIRGEFGWIKVTEDRPMLTGGGITVEGVDGDVVLRLELHRCSVEMADNIGGTSFWFGEDGLSCSMGPGDVSITACSPEAVSA